MAEPVAASPTVKPLQTPPHIQAFSRPDTYPHPVEHLEMIQTHASWVFLTGAWAYKFKKPVDFGFMDFSTLEKRHYYCNQELRLNRRLAPALYLDVLPVYQHGESFNLSGPDVIVDYCLKMVQFDQRNLLDRKLARHELKPAWMDMLANDVASFHACAEVCSNPEIDHAALLEDHIRDNLAVANRHQPRAASPATLQKLADFGRSELKEKQADLIQRQHDRHIRDCHGDLHFRNIALIDGRPTLFDCIEFNSAYRIIDTMNDIAFLVMDCDAHARPDLGMRFLSRYLEQSGDYAGLQLLPLYLFYRASVRGKVACMLADELPEAQQAPQWQEAQRYFELAASYGAASYDRGNSPTLFAIGGLSGSGKSHLALRGCGIKRAIIIRSDATRKRIAGDSPELDLYGQQMHIRTYAAMFDAARICINAGFSVILDATFLHPDSRRQCRELAEACTVPMQFFWLDIPVDQLKANILRRQQSGHDISDADLRVLDLQLAEYQRPDEPWVQFLTSNRSWPRRSDSHSPTSKGHGGHIPTDGR